MDKLQRYKNLLKSLFPLGRAFNKEENSVVDQYCEAIAGELVRIDNRAYDLVDESFVSKASELLDEHEEDYGLITSDKSIAERKIDLLLKQLSTGGLWSEYYKDIINEALGIIIDIIEYRPAWVGTVAIGDTVGDQEVLYKFLILIESLISDDPNERFRSVLSIINFMKDKIPAHMSAWYDWQGSDFDRNFGLAFDAFPTNDSSIVVEQFNPEFDSSFSASIGYDGEVLAGAFGKEFCLSYDSYIGGAYMRREFDSSFNIPI